MKGVEIENLVSSEPGLRKLKQRFFLKCSYISSFTAETIADVQWDDHDFNGKQVSSFFIPLEAASADLLKNILYVSCSF